MFLKTTTSLWMVLIIMPPGIWSMTLAFCSISLTCTVQFLLSKARQLFLTIEGDLTTVTFIPKPPPPGLVPSCAEAGVLGVLPGIIGTIQATETIKIILDKGGDIIRPAAPLQRVRHAVQRTQSQSRPGKQNQSPNS